MHPKKLILRQAKVIDIDIMTDFTLKLHQHEDDGTIEAHLNFHSNLKKWLSAELDNPNALFLIAEYEQCPIGFIGATSVINDNGFLANPLKGVIQLLWISSEYRNKHIANQLVAEVEICFKEVGIGYVECSYTNTNKLANKFWDKQGYKGNSITARKFLDKEPS